MSRAAASYAPELAVWGKTAEEHSSTFRQMLLKIKDLDQRLQETTAELNNEIETRRNWMKRANDVESRTKQQQFVLLLLDGNQTFCNDELIRMGSTGAKSVIKSLPAEILDAAKSKHKNDLSADIHVLIFIFVDIKRLATDLISAGSLSDQNQLTDFTHHLTASPFFSLVNCGQGKSSVDSKMKEHYELFIENVQCRHIILGLGHDSPYFETLDNYSEDEYTLGKTSLVKTVHGLPSKYDLPFHQVDLPTIKAVPLISFGAGPPLVVESNTLKDTNSVASSQKASSIDKIGTTAAAPNSSGSSQPPSGSGRDGSAPSSTTSHKASQDHPSNPRPASKTSSTPASGPVVGYPPPLEMYDDISASYEPDWETNVAPYTVPTFDLPWGAEQDAKGIVGDMPPLPAKEIPNPRYASAPRTQNSQRQQSVTTRPTQRRLPTSSSRGLVSIKGRWDDHITDSSEIFPFVDGPPKLYQAAKSIAGSLQSNEIALNKHGDRIDVPLPPLSESDKQRSLERSRIRKFCNEHHLRQACRNASCRYDHDPIDDGILLVLRHLARQIGCPVGSSCRMGNCPNGHHCPHRDRGSGSQCRHGVCKHKKWHRVQDFEIVEVITGSN